jgi:hypothetical protein
MPTPLLVKATNTQTVLHLFPTQFIRREEHQGNLLGLGFMDILVCDLVARLGVRLTGRAADGLRTAPDGAYRTLAGDQLFWVGGLPLAGALSSTGSNIKRACLLVDFLGPMVPTSIWALGEWGMVELGMAKSGGKRRR